MANYAPTTWATGDTITATKLNNVENGLNNLTIAGTANQVLVNGATTAVNNAAITLTLPQSIATGSSPTFAGLRVDPAAGSSYAYIDRPADTNAAAVQFLTANAIDWVIGPGYSGAGSDFKFYSGGTSSDVFTLARATGNATFAGTVGGTTISASAGFYSSRAGSDTPGTYAFDFAGVANYGAVFRQAANGDVVLDTYNNSAWAEKFRVTQAGNATFAAAVVTIASMQAAAAATNVSLNASGQLQQDTSSIRFKENVTDMAEWRQMLAGLRPRTFDWCETIKVDAVHRHDFGFIAEEAAAVDSRIASYSKGNVQSVRYQLLVAPLVAGWQDHEARIAALEAKCA